MFHLGDIDTNTGRVYLCRNKYGPRFVTREQFDRYAVTRKASGDRYTALHKKGCGRGHKVGWRHSEATRKKMSEYWIKFHHGGASRSSKWHSGKSGIGKAVRSMVEYRQWRRDVFSRDDHKCTDCGAEGYINSHHIKSLATIIHENSISSIDEARRCRDLWDVSNGQTLCECCHGKKDKYKARFMKKQNGT